MLIRSRSIAVVRRQTAFYTALAGAALSVAAALLGRLLMAGGVGSSWAVGVFMMLMGCFLALICAAVALTSRGEPIAGRRFSGTGGVIDVSGGDIRVKAGARELRIPRKSIVAGWLEASGARPLVILQTRWGTAIHAQIDDATSAERLLRLAGVAPEQRAITMFVGFPAGMGGILDRAARMLGLGFLGLLGVLVGLGLLMAGLPGILFGLLLAGASVSLMGRALDRAAPWSIRVGTDGIVLKRIVRQVLPFSRLESAEAQGAAILLHVKDEESLQILTSSSEEASAFVARILQAKAAGEGGSDADWLNALDRSGRSLSEWRAALASLARPSGGYREKRVDPSELIAVVEDTRAPIPRRVAAAVALASSDKELQDRARDAVDACADDRLRVALDKALVGEIDEDLIEEAEIASRALV